MTWLAKRILMRLMKMKISRSDRYVCAYRKAILKLSHKPSKLFKKMKKSKMIVAQKVQMWKSRKPSQTQISFNLNTR